MVIAEIQIVEVFPDDLRILQEISKRTFHQSFSAMNTAENMNFFLDHHYSTEKLAYEIRNPDSRFFFARHKDDVVGYLKINRGDAQTVLPNDQGLEIERIYVDEAFKGAGIGKRFIEKSVELAIEFKAKYIWLGVWEQNVHAIGFYERNGFKHYSNHIFKLGEDDQTDLLLKRFVTS